ncbi:MAG: nitronate monooxygenase [Hyphomicrobiaceae bacterium]|nr:nitronate monooxygenase [Hyphomicrobiaceae bacterium]
MRGPRTPLCDRLGLAWPIFGFSHSIDVTVALANAGCFPVYGAAWDLPDVIAAKMRAIRDRVGDRPFGINLMLPASVGEETDRKAVEARLPAEHRAFVERLRAKYRVPAATKPTFFSSQVRSQKLFAEQIEAALASEATALASAIGTSAETVARAKAAGKLTISLIGSPKHARSVKAAGVDIIVAQGHDAAGHTGPIGTFSLVPQVVDIAGDTPVLAAGGVGCGRQIAAALALGAQGVWLGTAWLTAREHDLEAPLLRKVLAASAEDTIISRSHSGKTCRMLKTAWTDEWEAAGAPKPLPMPNQQVLTGELLAAINEHQIEPLMYTFCGQGVAYYDRLRSVPEIVERLVDETRQALAGLSSRS